MEVTLWFILLCVLVVLYLIQSWRQRRLIKHCHLKESSSLKVPLLGHSVNLIGNSEVHFKYVQKLGKEAFDNDGIIALWMMSEFLVLISDPIKAEFLLKNCLDKGDLIKPIREVLGYGSIFAPVEFWRPRRKLIVPTFTSRNLSLFVNIFEKQSSIMVEKLKSKVGAGPFSIWLFLTTYNFDTVCESTFGLKVNSQNDPDHPFLRTVAEGLELICNRVMSPWLHSEFVYRLTPASKLFYGYREFGYNLINKIVSAKRKECEEIKNNGTNKQDADGIVRPFIQLLLETSTKVTDVEMMEEAGVLLVAATDTSAVAAAFCLLLLAAHPEIQEKAYIEIKEVVGDLEGPLTAETLSRLKYLECVLKESLRLYPPAPLITRKSETDVTLPSGEVLPKNTQIFISLWSIHHNPKYWGEDVDVFRPERFMEPFKHPAQYMVFSNGPRNCIGYKYAFMSLKTVFVNILQHYVIKPASAAPYNQWKQTHRPMRLKFDIMLKSSDDFLIELEERRPV